MRVATITKPIKNAALSCAVCSDRAKWAVGVQVVRHGVLDWKHVCDKHLKEK